MAAKYGDIECVICSENIVDPRALPCGHSYCGPPRLCLNSMINAMDGLCCAVCRTDHDLKPKDIKPLYGIRDCFLANSNSQTETGPDVFCTEHKDKECSFWCIECEVMICAACTEDQHDCHPVRNLKKYLVEKVESLFGKSLMDATTEYDEKLRMLIDSETLQLAKAKLEVSEIENRLTLARKQRRIIGEYIGAMNNSYKGERANETVLLLNMSNLQLMSAYLGRVLDESEKSSVSISASKTDCLCQFPHSLPITFKVNLRISKRYPFVVEPSDSLHACPYNFWLHADLVPHRTNPKVKLLRFTLSCSNPHGDDNLLPSFKYRYRLTLEKNNESSDKTREGIWIYPKNKKINWYCISSAELSNAARLWINRNGCLSIDFQLSD